MGGGDHRGEDVVAGKEERTKGAGEGDRSPKHLLSNAQDMQGALMAQTEYIAASGTQQPATTASLVKEAKNGCGNSL